MIVKNARPGPLCGACAGHAAHNGAAEIIISTGVPAQQPAQHGQRLIGHRRATCVLDPVQQSHDLGAFDVADLASTQHRKYVALENPPPRLDAAQLALALLALQISLCDPLERVRGFRLSLSPIAYGIAAFGHPTQDDPRLCAGFLERLAGLDCVPARYAACPVLHNVGAGTGGCDHQAKARHGLIPPDAALLAGLCSGILDERLGELRAHGLFPPVSIPVSRSLGYERRWPATRRVEKWPQTLCFSATRRGTEGR